MHIKKPRYYSIRNVMLLSFIIIIVIMVLNMGLLSLQYRNILDQLNINYQRLNDAASFSQTIDRIHYDVTGYAEVSESDRELIRTSYITNYDAAQQSLTRLQLNVEYASYHHLTDLSNMLQTMDDAVLQYFDASDTSVLPSIYVKPQRDYIDRLKDYIQDELNSYSSSLLRESQKFYETAAERRNRLELQMVFSTGMVLAFCFVTALLFSRIITKPIRKLANHMKNFDASGQTEKFQDFSLTSSEVASLIGSYNKMTNRIYELINELTEKAGIERQLSQQQVDNLEMRNLLKQTELHMLQMQINPHFLFNTLNSIHALASMENADQSAQMIGNLAKILRYALRDLDRNVPLRDEMENVSSYIDLQKLRFGSRIKFIINTDETVMDATCPGMIIQPLIENAIMHGFDREGKTGRIMLSVIDEIELITIMVKDDGIGMDSKTVDDILEGGRSETDNAEVKGIGLDNVLRRMRILYGEESVRISSKPGLGTTILLRIPKT